MDLSQLRQQIDTIDRQIVDLYEKRMDVSRQVAEYKIETGKKVFDKQREQEKIAGVKALTQRQQMSIGWIPFDAVGLSLPHLFRCSQRPLPDSRWWYSSAAKMSLTFSKK